MKIWSHEHFEMNLPEVIQLPVEQALHRPELVISTHWIASLPIAAALYRVSGSTIEKIVSNGRYDQIADSSEIDFGIDSSFFANMLLDMEKNGGDSHVAIWRSSHPIHVREHEVTVSRYGDEADIFLLTAVDRSLEKRHDTNMRREMFSDSLTGFFNRPGFEEEIEAKLKGHNTVDVPAQFGLLLIDLQRFSRVNESMGALAGDELIITVAKRLKARVRSNEILCRLGGNEFALFLLLEDEENIDLVANRLCTAFQDPCRLSGFDIQIECAMSGASGVVGIDDPMDILRHAQIALKRAKLTSRFEHYVPGTVDKQKRRFSIETDLRLALENRELELHYQPLMDLATGELSGFEALARWNHPEKGYISPVDFIPVAEESGLIVPLGRWALEEAANSVAAWDKAAGRELPVKVSVNLSAVQLARDDIVAVVERVLQSAGIGGHRMTLELTESAFVSEPEAAKRILDALKALNTNLAMDDFGTGYSNLAYLQQLPIDVLKIDRSFVSGIMDDKDKRAIVRTVLSLAETLGMQTTAEGVETIEVSSALKELGCSFGQGYYYARPLDPDATNQFLRTAFAAPTS
jgi:c-di-GMP phosphodiesterase Gmr